MNGFFTEYQMISVILPFKKRGDQLKDENIRVKKERS